MATLASKALRIASLKWLDRDYLMQIIPGSLLCSLFERGTAMSTKGLRTAKASFHIEDRSSWDEGTERFNNVFCVELNKLAKSERYAENVEVMLAHLTSRHGANPLKFVVELSVSGTSLGDILNTAESLITESAEKSNIRLVKTISDSESDSDDIYERQGTQLLPA